MILPWFKQILQMAVPECHVIACSRNWKSQTAWTKKLSMHAPVIPSKNLWPKFKLVKKQKSQKCTFCDSDNFKHNWSTNEYHQGSHNDCAKLQLKGFHSASIQIFNFFQPISLSKSIFQTIWTTTEVITYLMECMWVKCTHPSNTPTCTLQLSSNTTKVTHMSSYAPTMFSHYDTSKWTQFSSDHATCKPHSCHYTTSEFHKLGINAEQIACFIINHSILHWNNI